MVQLPLAHVVGASSLVEHFAHIAGGILVIVGVVGFHGVERRKLRRRLAISEARLDTVFGEHHGPVTPPRHVSEAAVWAAALGLAGAALIHAAVAPEHFAEGTPYGLFFVIAGVLQLCGVVAVLASPSRPLLNAAAAGSLAVVLLWLTTRTVGLPIGADPWHAEPLGMLDVVSSGFELITAAGALAARRSVRD